MKDFREAASFVIDQYLYESTDPERPDPALLDMNSDISSATIHHHLVTEPHKDPKVRSALASRPNISPDTIHHALVTKPDPDPRVRYHLARSRNIRQDTKDAYNKSLAK